MADAVFWHQTSMSPQFALIGLPSIQVGVRKGNDLIVRNDLCHYATTGEELLEALEGLNDTATIEPQKVLDALGIGAWKANLSRFITEPNSLDVERCADSAAERFTPLAEDEGLSMMWCALLPFIGFIFLTFFENRYY